jgi:hypothetical protein
MYVWPWLCCYLIHLRTALSWPWRGARSTAACYCWCSSYSAQHCKSSMLTLKHFSLTLRCLNCISSCVMSGAMLLYFRLAVMTVAACIQRFTLLLLLLLLLIMCLSTVKLYSCTYTGFAATTTAAVYDRWQQECMQYQRYCCQYLLSTQQYGSTTLSSCALWPMMHAGWWVTSYFNYLNIWIFEFNTDEHTTISLCTAACRE